MHIDKMTDLVVQALEDMKAQNILILDVEKRTAVTDKMIIATGTSSRHVQAIVSNVSDAIKKQGIKTNGIEGRSASDWILLDMISVVLHVMTAQARQFYDLERLWGEPEEPQENAQS